MTKDVTQNNTISVKSQVKIETFLLPEGGRLRVRNINLEISDVFVSYSISLKPIKLSFETE